MATTGGRTTTGPGGPRPTTNPGSNVSQREDLANFISQITRDETPFMSSIGKTKASAIYHEWQTDELNAPGNSKLVDGADFRAPVAGNAGSTAANDDTGNVANTFNVGGPERTRLGNYAQINGKTIAVSGTRRAVDQAGIADEYAYQLKKRGTELRRDVEADLIGNQVSSGSGVRAFGGYASWINDTATIEYAGTGSTAPTTVGRGTHAYTPSAASTRGSLSLSQIDSVMQKIYEEGGKASKIMLSPKLRRDFSDLMVTDSGVRRNIDMDGKLRQSVDIYMSDFGDLMVMPNYIMGLGSTADTAAYIYDPQWFAVATLRPLQEVDVGQQGDSTVGMMVEECTLEVKNPLGCGAIYNLA